jgi:hypothetical protein
MGVGPSHPFYVCLNGVLDGSGFDAFVEKRCARFYADKLDRLKLSQQQSAPLLVQLRERLLAWKQQLRLSIPWLKP